MNATKLSIAVGGWWASDTVTQIPIPASAANLNAIPPPQPATNPVGLRRPAINAANATSCTSQAIPAASQTAAGCTPGMSAATAAPRTTTTSAETTAYRIPATTYSSRFLFRSRGATIR
jgi:hypothetical protein